MLNPNKSKLRHLTWIPEYNKIIAEPKMIGFVLKPYNSHGECNAQQNQVIVNTAACNRNMIMLILIATKSLINFYVDFSVSH